MTERPDETTGPALLERIIPFQFLTAAERARLAGRLAARRVEAGGWVVRQGEESRDLFLLAEGRVEVLDESREPPKRVDLIEPGHYFGERAALFDQARACGVRARDDVLVHALPGAELVRLVREVPAFAMAMANLLKNKQGIFDPYRRLYARILWLIDRREFLLAELLPAYEALRPALHPGLAADWIDTGALAYAAARLPAEVTRTSSYYLAGDLPLLYRDPDQKFEPVSTRARRRAAWRPLPGKLIVLLRDGITDVTDFLTCLSLYAVEARKIRHRLRSSELLRRLRPLAEAGAGPEEGADLLACLPLDERERVGLAAIWRDAFWRRLRDVLIHHEDIAIECDYRIEAYNSHASERWVSQIRARAGRLVDLDDPELEVHIVSSNTHSVANCLSPWLADRRDELVAWARERRPELCGAPTDARPWGERWRDPCDLAYVTARDYLREVEGAAEARRDADRRAGHDNLVSTAFTGIEVDLFDGRRLDPAAVDPAVGLRRPERPTLVVNIDYAFGQQAEEILSNLLFEFGLKVRSINVIGKAGGLVGRRGDLLLPRATILQTNDELYRLPNVDLPVDLLRELAPDLGLHEGPVLTVAGTLLQDPVLLRFYERIWKCVGLEMEGSFFARQLLTAMEQGVIGPDVATRFVYYTSDLPLATDANLSERLAPWEGVPPLYAITRAILRRIFVG